MDPVTLGILLLLVGVVLTVLTWFLLRVFSQTRRAEVELPGMLQAGLEMDEHQDGLLVVEPGGRILYCNEQVRRWFDLVERTPVLELLVRQARPGSELLNLCAREGKARLNVRGRTLEAHSYAFPGQNYGQLMMVVLRAQPAGGLITNEDGQAGQALGVFTELSQAMAASLELEPTLEAVLENVERLIPADFAEITLWSPGRQELVPYRFIGLAGLDRQLVQADERYKPGEGYSGYLITERQALLVQDVDAPNVVYPALDRQKYPFRAYLGVPLIAAKELVGTLELASFDKNRFSAADRETLELLGGQAAVALHNATLFEQEQQQARELVGLARLVQATSSVSDPEQLISRLVDSLSGLFDVERLGFLLYDESRRMLVCQAPFIGIPGAVVELYRVPVPEGSPASDVIQSEDMIIASHAPTHRALELLGLNHVAEAAGMRDTILVPLASSGRFLGYLQVANKADGQPFSDEDIRLLAIVAGQIGPLLGNASLIQETRRRAQRSEALRRISNLAGSAATLDEILQFSLQELQNMLDADAAVIFLLDEQVGELRIHRSSLIGVEADALAEVDRLPLDSPDFAGTVTSTQRNFFTRNASADERILPHFRGLVQAEELQALIDVPLVIRDRGVGEMVLVSRGAEAFEHSDLIFAATAAGQLAGAVERSILYSQTDEKLRRRVDELTALTMIGRELGSAENLEALLQRVLEEVGRLTQADAGRFVMLNNQAAASVSQPYLVTGDHPQLPPAAIEIEVLESRKPRLVEDFETEEAAPLAEGIRSAVLAPINFEGRTLGVLHLWAGQPAVFDAAAFDIALAFGVQAAAGLSNSLRLQDQARQNELLYRRVNTLTRLLETSPAQQVSQPLEASMQAVAAAVQEATPFRAVLISIYDARSKQLQRAAGAGFSAGQFQEMQRFQQPWASIQEYLQEKFRLGQTYFIPTEKKPIDPPDVHTVYVLKPRELEADRTAWNPDDLLLVPILGAEGEPLGLISVDDPRNGLRPDQATLETLELFASQAALTIASYLKLQDYEGQISQMRQRMERAEKAAAATQANLPTLLRKDREQTVLLHHLSRQSDHIRAGLEIAELVYQQASRAAAFELVGRELLLRFGWDVVLIAETGEGGPRLVHTRGSIKDSEGLDALLGQRNPLRQSLQSGDILMENDVSATDQWQNTALLQAIEAGAFICFPLAVQDRPEAVVLVAGKAPQESFSAEDRSLYRLLAGQVSLALRNIQLITNTQQRLQEVNLLLAFTRQLGSLETGAILDTLIDTALKVAQNAEGGAVLLWDAQSSQLLARAARGYPQAELLIGVNYPLQGSLPGRAFQGGQTLRVDEVHFAQDYALSQEDLLRYRDATQGRLPVSTLVVQIRSGDQPLGVLVLDDFRTVGGFSLEDQALIDSLAQQTALALENARLFQASERRAHQLQALTEISGEMSASLQSEELIATLLPRLKAVSSYDTATLWLRFDERLTVSAVDGFDDTEERLGLTVETKDSRLLSEMIASGKPIVVGDMHGDARFPSLVETPHHSWLGLPLIAKGDVIGVVALEKTERDFYQPDSIQILTAFASQAAVSLQNATLFDDSVRRALEMDQQTQRLASLNRFATTLSSSLDINQIMKTIISEIQRQISSPAISIVLFDRLGRGQLWAEAPTAHETLPVRLPEAPLFEHLRQTQSFFTAEDVSAEPDLAPLQDFLEGPRTRSLLVAPMATGGEVQGAVFIHENRRVRQFSAEEIDLLRTITSQAAISVQNAQLYEESQLRLNELAAINQISQNISATIDLEVLFARLPEQLAAIVDTDNLYLALFDPLEDRMVFPLAYEEGQPVELPPRPAAGLTGYILQSGEPLLLHGDSVAEQLEALGAQQFGKTVAASYLGVPLLAGERVIGVIAVQSPDNPEAYQPEDVRLLSTVAAQIAVAIENSRLYSETRQRSADLALLFDFSTSIANVLDEQKLVEITFEELEGAFGADGVAVVTQDEAGGWSAALVEGGQRRFESATPGAESLTLQVVENGYPLVVDLLEKDADPAAMLGITLEGEVANWMGVPLTVRGATFGVLSLVSRQHKRFTENHLQLITQIGNQLSTALDGARLFAQVQDYAAELEDRVSERTHQLAQEHQRTETLLRIITELSASLDMDIVLNRTLALINQIVGAEQSTILLVEAGQENLLRRASFGYARPAPEGGERIAIRADEGLAGWVIAQRQYALIPDVHQDDRWLAVAEGGSEHTSALAAPLMVGEDVLGVLMLFHREADHFSENDLELVQATAKQIAVAINNSKLYRLIRDQAERLGDMLRTQHVEMSRSQAILEAVADGVLVTDAEGQITLFNASAERILELKRSQVLSRSLENFTGLFGREARSWMETIRAWSKSPDAYEEGDVYAEQVELDDGRVVSVHLSPVRLRNEFLGTVSIFRDITHEVEVDRLKSEFVANVSHELRTPMTSIKGYVDILLMGASGELNQQQRTFLEVVRSNTERLVVLVNDLLEVSRLEAGKINLNIEAVDLRLIANDVAEELRQRSVREERLMNINVEAEAKLSRALADPERVRQIVDNLVDNAYHYTPADGRITIRLSEQADQIQVDVQDNGIGIPLADQEQIFERFYRGEDPLVLETPGTGLGLSVVKTLVEMHQGRIWLTSTGIPGQGSTFSFTLPAALADREAVLGASMIEQ